MDKECRYVETTEYGNYCSLNHQACNNHVPNDQCEDIENYWKYLQDMGVEIVAEEEIEEMLLQEGENIK